MDIHKHEELNDELLEREIETALDVDPSPEFLARVRTRVAEECIDERSAWLSGWGLTGAAVAAVIVVVIGLWVTRERAPAPAQSTLASETRDLKPVPRDSGIAAPVIPEPRILNPDSAPAVIASSNVSKPTVPTRQVHAEPLHAQAEVLISQDEAAALRQLFTAISNGRFDTATIPDLDAALQPPAEIEAIVVEPLSLKPLAALESE